MTDYQTLFLFILLGYAHIIVLTIHQHLQTKRIEQLEKIIIGDFK